MTRKAKAVIGAGYGDEGKGLMTDYHGSNGADVVVRTNGGAQAGHTVETADGRRHVFHHVGSAAFLNIPTHLSQFFILNPIFLRGEIEELQGKGVTPWLSADPRAIVTTPFDMLINQIVETARAGGRHGSCGLGIGETVERNLDPRLALSFADLERGPAFLWEKLLTIRKAWVSRRLDRLGVTEIPTVFENAIADDGIIDRFIADCEDFRRIVSRCEDGTVKGDIVFEGAQGLLLDQDFGAFPYVTRSNTGLKNIVEFCREAAISSVDVTYATRCYTTRHGAGPLAHADVPTSWLAMVDPTNAPNPWQGSIRSAPLETDVLGAAIRHDLTYAKADIECNAVLSVSCLDQVTEGYGVVDNGVFRNVVPSTAGDVIGNLTGIPSRYLSYGPTRETISDMAA